MRRLLALLFRERCGGCGEWGAVPLCSACIASWPEPALAACPDCGLPGTARHDCPAGLDSFGRAFAVAPYAGVAREACRAFKYRRQRRLASPLAARLAASPAFPVGDWLVVPVPVHAARRRERGYDQAALLARALARHRGLRWAEPLRRMRVTRPQVGLSRSEREHNVAGVFRCVRPVAGRRVLLVDDVMTTGATVASAARALREAGAAEVWVGVIARASRP